MSNISIPKKKETLNINRKKMPQIDSKDLNIFKKFLSMNNINFSKDTVHPDELKASQGNFDKDKIASIVDAIENDEYEAKPVIISSDNFVVDGHHRWLAHANLDKELDVIRADADAKTLIDVANDFPQSYNEQALKNAYFTFLSEDFSKTNETIISKDQMETFCKTVDKLFARFGIEFDFTKHFNERMLDKRNNPIVTMKNLAEVIKNLYNKLKTDGKTISKHLDAEAVINDLQSDINIPIKVEFNRKNDDLVVVAKTIMRKKNFTTPDPKIEV